ncbi:MAG: gamma-glutamyltransferase [Candidatus Nanopelagicales bacterium]
MQYAVRSSVANGGPGSSAIAAGSRATAQAGATILRAGGNAVDALIGAAMAATVAEQSVSSIGGGGFLLVRHPNGETVLCDFFVDTPGRGLPVKELELHFLPMDIQFPGTVQTFHAGMGSVAVPGMLAGILDAHDRFSRLPFDTLVAPALRYASEGVPLEPMQEVLGRLIREMVALSPESLELFAREGRFLQAGDLIFNRNLAAFLARIASGEVTDLTSPAFSEPLLAAMANGGLLTAADLAAYEVVHREPVTVTRNGATLATNPPPSFGGSIIAETMGIAARVESDRPQTWAALLGTLDEATTRGRATRAPGSGPLSLRGTTHLSAVDADGMIAAMTISNGITSGFVVPGTGIQLNNMLGEADLNPAGFHATPPGLRMGSMMSPTVLTKPDGSLVALGTGGSERIRSAITEVCARLIDLGQDLDSAVSAGRAHHDAHGIQVEPNVEPEIIAALQQALPGQVNVWESPDVYFGGVNAVTRHPDGSVQAVGDGRRGGCGLVVSPD